MAIFNSIERPQATGSVVTVSSAVSAFFPIILDLADDKAPFTAESVATAEYAMSLSGSLVTWRKYVGKPITVSVVALSASDLALQTLLDTSTPKIGLLPVLSFISLTVLTPTGYTRTFTNGILMEGAFAPSMNNNGRFDSREYKFVFGASI